SQARPETSTNELPETAAQLETPNQKPETNPPPLRSADCQSAVSPTASRPALDTSPAVETSQQPDFNLQPERQRTGALPDAPRSAEPSATRASVPECGSPLPLSNPSSCTPAPPSPTAQAPQLLNSLTPKLLNSQTSP